MHIRYLTILFTLWLLASPAFGANSIKGWKVMPAPSKSDALASCAHEPEYILSVKLKQGVIEVDKLTIEEFFHWWLNSQRELPQFSVGKFKHFPRFTIPVPDGTLVGYNRGEWGGAVWWFSKDRKVRREVSKHQVGAFFERDGEIYAFDEGYAMVRTRGALVKFEVTPSGNWNAETIAILPRGIGPFTWIGPKEFLIVSDNKLVRMSLDGDRQTVHTSESGFARTSAIVVDAAGIIYVGTGSVVVRLTPRKNAYLEEWLVSSDVDSCLKRRADAIKFSINPVQK